MLDYIIVGQGLAGSLLTWQLLKDGARVKVIDAPQQTAATQVAAGIINPITGRRLVKTWMIEELLTSARQLYRKLEQDTGCSFYHERPLIRTIYNRGDENDWLARQADPEYTGYLGDIGSAGPFAPITQAAFGYGYIQQAVQVDIGALQLHLRTRWLANGTLSETTFTHQQLQLSQQGVRYGDWQAKRLIFCEGWRATLNPYFQHLPFACTKGEAVWIEIPSVQLSSIFKHRVMVAPLAAPQYWVGATSSHDFSDDLPTASSLQYFKNNLDRILTADYQIVSHQAAIRPTVRDRRPLLGQHPQHPALYIFNGLGTKGASLAPFWTQHFLAFLKGEIPLHKEVDIHRFKK